jgi:hypothetical protein
MAVIEAIATTYLEADTATVTFSSLGSYEHLQLRISSKSDRDYQWDPIAIVFNSDTGSNYTYHALYGEGSDEYVGAGTGLAAALTIDGTTGNASKSAEDYGTTIVDIYDYRNTNKNTTFLCLNGRLSWTTGAVWNSGVSTSSGFWDSTAAVTSIAMTVNNGTNFVRGSEFTLYGLNSA